jgi:predicted peroxiredoxin
MRLLYIVTKGTDDPTLASVPLHIAANGSLEIGQDTSVVLAGDATDLLSTTTPSVWRAWAYLP